MGPAHDGGYYLIALKRSSIHRALFDGVEWSSPSVLSSTLDRCRDLGLSTVELETGYDVDMPEDLERLAVFLASDDTIDCPRTRELLRIWNINGGSRTEEAIDEDS